MKATYIGTGARDDDVLCRVFGMDFPLNEAVDTSDLPAEQQALLDGNPTFTTDTKPPKAKPAPAPAPADNGGL